MALRAIFAWPASAGWRGLGFLPRDQSAQRPVANLALRALDGRMAVLSQSLGRHPPAGEGSADGFTKNIASCDFFLAGFRPLVLRPASCRAVFWHRYGRGAARVPGAGVV